MRKLTRLPQPQCLADNAKNWTEEYIAAKKNNPKHRFSWRDKQRDNSCYQNLRKRLSEMTQGHCAFCDGRIGTESRETIEHFRPKKLFPELAYTWLNLFPCCDLCQSKKREKFDENLLKPDEANYEFGKYFLANYKTGEIEPIPNASEDDITKAKITITIYGLNLPERAQARLRELKHFSNDNEPIMADYNYRYFLE